MYHDKWMQNGIFYVIMLSKHQMDFIAPLLGAAFCYRDSTSSTFAFRPDPMTPILLDMAALFSFRPCEMSIDILGDYKLKNRRIETPMKATRTEIVPLQTYSRFVMIYQGMANCDHEHIMLLLFWLNKFIFPNADGGVKPEYLHLAETLHNEVGVATCPFTLASLYQCLHQINVCGPVWMAQMWLE